MWLITEVVVRTAENWALADISGSRLRGEGEWGVPKQTGEWIVFLSVSADSGVIPALRNVAERLSGGQLQRP